MLLYIPNIIQRTRQQVANDAKRKRSCYLVVRIRLVMEAQTDGVTKSMKSHTVHSFDKELESIRDRVMAMGGFTEQQLSDALTAFINGR
uniref:Uncharacterized protein n=1 Tax=Candidatus Kentrum sp. SD TaxID=2126332 RepID=A0A450YAC5_9GAMM|nr:MAG: hypothetical protein BECKSD772F_GA0070984_10255 [Candidatus Kentron sp. SD]VFK44834.1 MAG: hypothetical protein BECKSD772E_GA0070983_104416 [Candidatus Kentron sp. SD]VFK80043.1 MAG: hypothetical protein BECKSD772D_GA0070982_10817 [Candidatus Kentron sp. SD]